MSRCAVGHGGGKRWIRRFFQTGPFAAQFFQNPEVVPGRALVDVIAAVDRQLERFGGRGAYGRGIQLSARFLDEEFRQLAAAGMIVLLVITFAANGLAIYLRNRYSRSW